MGTMVSPGPSPMADNPPPPPRPKSKKQPSIQDRPPGQSQKSTPPKPKSNKSSHKQSPIKKPASSSPTPKPMVKANNPQPPPSKPPPRDSFGKKGFYAGAGFDRSPAAHTLPPPSFLLKSPGRPIVASSSQLDLPHSTLDSTLTPTMTTTTTSTKTLTRSIAIPSGQRPVSQAKSLPARSADDDDLGDLRDKSRRLMAMLREGETRQQQQQQTPATRPVSGEQQDLEAMTQEVRRMLRLS